MESYYLYYTLKDYWMKSDEGKREVAAVETIKNAGLSVEEVPDHITDALTRDYSGLMKAMDKKKRG